MHLPDPKAKLQELLELPSETEWAEFKEAKTNFDSKELGRYFSALSNEANLKQRPCGWLIFGVSDNRKVVGTQYRKSAKDLESLKHELAEHTTGNITFREIHTVKLPEGRVLLFQIPAAPRGIPVAYRGHFYGRNGESLVALNLQEQDQIRHQGRYHDWSAELCESATLQDLDPEALQRARQEYTIKNPRLAVQMLQWDNQTFLQKLRLIINGKLTRAAIVLLGREEADHFISPAQARITWLLKDEQNPRRDYAHFGPPLLLRSDEVRARIRNLTYRYIADNTLFPTEISQYDDYVLREVLHNCIAHQDYELKGRINVVEKPNELIFTNLGSFAPGSVEHAIERDAPPERYRNDRLVKAMVELNMIDTVGSGIRTMFLKQRDRFFPLPTYSLDDPERVEVIIPGEVIDIKYTRLLIKRPDLPITTVIALDKVQKRLPLPDEQAKLLRQQGLIEGRKPHYFISSTVARVVKQEAAYIRNKAFDNDYYKDLILQFLQVHKQATREQLNELLLDKLSDLLNGSQKLNRVRYLISKLSSEGKIINKGTRGRPRWVLQEPVKKPGQ